MTKTTGMMTGFALLAAMSVAGCAGDDGDASGAAAATTATATVTATTTVTAFPATPADDAAEQDYSDLESADVITVDDFKLRVKILSKNCFGSAGCNIEYEIVPVFQREISILEDATLDLTYRVIGGEEPQIGTLSFDGSSYNSSTESTGTVSSSDKLTARPTEVSQY